MKRCDTRSSLRASAAVVVALLVGSGCVTRGRYDEVVQDRNRLAAEVDRLSATSESLESERVRLMEEMEDLREERETLDRDVKRLRKAEAQLSRNLAARESELAERNRELSRLRGTYDSLVQDLEAEVAAGQIEIEQLREGLRLNVTQDILFSSGSAQLNATGQRVLRKVAKQLKELPHAVEVQGHTDDVPIASNARSRFPSNWELAGARSARVVRLLADAGVTPVRLRAVSFGEYHPVASNDTPEGRLRNRRIEIRLEPLQPEDLPAEAEPAS